MAAFWCTFCHFWQQLACPLYVAAHYLWYSAIVAAHCLYIYESMMRDLQIKELQNMGDFIYFILLQCMRACFCCNVFHEMYLQYSNTFSTTSKRTWPREINHVPILGLSATALPNQTAGRERLQAGMVTGREGVTGRNPLIPRVEQISSRIGS